jgi:mannose-6-phosphate isomerase
MNKIGVIAGNFDVFHPGYIKMFTEAERNCDQLFVLLHVDPKIERPNKLKPILSVDERMEMLYALSSVHYVIPYNTEAELYLYLKENQNEISVRFLGDDYKDKPFTGDDLNIPIYYLNRDHGWSTSRFKQLIFNSLKETDKRPWGKYEVLLDTPDCKVKQITVNPGGKLSYQYHTKRREQWTVVSGEAVIILDDEKLFRTVGESIKIPLGAKHRIINEGEEDLIFIEVQTGSYFGEDDIIRIEDEYNRN